MADGEKIHAGHRERLKRKYLEYGLDSFTDIEALELLLFYAIPRRSTNELAHALLDRFKGFRGVMEADQAALQSVPGIGENAAALIRLVSSLHGRYAASEDSKSCRISSSAEAGEYLLPYFRYLQEESSVLLCMDMGGRVINCHRLTGGAPGMVEIAARELVKLALQDRAAKVILSHNHLSGVALPSAADAETTGKLRQMLRMLNIELVDHIIVSDGDFVSMRDSGYFQQG